MIFVREAFFADIFVIALGRVVRRVEIEKADRTVVLSNQFLEVPVLNNHITESDVRLFNQRKIPADIVRLTSKAGQSGSVAIANQLIKLSRLLHVSLRTVPQGTFSLPFGQIHLVPRKFGTDTVEFLAGIECVPQFVNQFIVFVADTTIKVHK